MALVFRLFVRTSEQEFELRGIGTVRERTEDALKRLRNGELYVIAEYGLKLVYFARVVDRKIELEYDPAGLMKKPAAKPKRA